ncbi:chorismate-binding protein [Nocardiopsis sp. NPDC006198]|uniref:chorismate-binding protein n=1 Tax=Nocardiopsis sp. NPDC006198 TaxID=3154472 RepID=UPI0033BE9D54
MPEQRTPAPAPSVVELLASYRPGDTFFSTGAGALHGTGVLGVAEEVHEVDSLLGSAGPEGVVMGAIPFDGRRSARFLLPRTVRHAPAPPRGRAPGLRRRPLPGEWGSTPVPAPDEHRASIERAIALTAGDGGPDRVVSARGLRLHSTSAVDPFTALNNLLWRDPGEPVFAIDVPGPGAEDRTLLGTGPELLVSKRGSRVASQPLSGSVPRSADPTKDYRNRERLRASAGDRREHAVVVDAVAESLEPYCRTLAVPKRPELVATATMWHLSTRLEGTLLDADVPAHLLAAALRPAPAVCGSLSRPASGVVGAPEPFDRGFHSGAVGYSTARGDGEWVVAARCAEVFHSRVDAFVGGGVMSGSDPGAVLSETTDRMRALLFALGVR